MYKLIKTLNEPVAIKTELFNGSLKEIRLKLNRIKQNYEADENVEILLFDKSKLCIAVFSSENIYDRIFITFQIIKF